LRDAGDGVCVCVGGGGKPDDRQVPVSSTRQENDDVDFVNEGVSLLGEFARLFLRRLHRSTTKLWMGDELAQFASLMQRTLIGIRNGTVSVHLAE
jgi:hypothetical protein